MSSNLFYDSDDERDSFDVERRQIEIFRENFLSASIESSEDDDEGIIDGTKIPSSTKTKSRARHSFLDISTLSSSPSIQLEDDDDDNEQNPFDIISKSIDIENIKPIKKKKSLGVPKSRVILDTTDIYDRDDSNHSRDSFTKNFDDKSDNDDIQSSKTKSDKSRVRKPTKAAVLETERKMQQLSRSEHLVLPTFIPKPLETWHALEKRSRQELMNEIRAKNPSFTPQDPDLPELPVMDIESSAASTLAELTKLIADKPSTSTNTLNKLSQFLNPDILKKKPTMSNNTKESNTMIDLSDTKKVAAAAQHPTIKSKMNISFDCIKSPSSSKKLLDMQKQLGIRMQAKRAAMLAEHTTNMPIDEDEEEEEEEEEEQENNDEDSMDTTNESIDANSEIISNADKENDNLQIDEETRHFMTDEEDNDEEEQEEAEEEEEEKENTNPNRPSLKTVLTRMDSSNEPVQVQPTEQNGQTEWFNSSRPAQFDTNLELLCSGAFDGDNVIPLSQNRTHVEPMAFSPLPPTQIEEEEEPDIEVRRPKVRQLIDDDDDDDDEVDGANKQISSGSNVEEIEEEEEEEEGEEDNEELVDYKKQLFEMEAEESEDEANPKDKDKDDESDSDDDEEADEELQKFIDTGAIEMDENDIDDMAKVHLKLKAKEDEQQLKLLKEQYLDFDGDDDGRRIQISKARDEDDDEEDPDYNSEMEEEDDDDEEEDPINLKDRMSELERQRSIQDSQAEELHLNEDLDSIGQNSSMFQKGLALKQKKIQSTTVLNIESTSQTTVDSTSRKGNQTRAVTLSSVLLAKRFSTTLLAPVNKNSLIVNNTNETTKKQHNPRRHIFSTNMITVGANENQNPVPTATSSGEKRANSAEKSSRLNVKRFKQSTTSTTAATTIAKSKESSTSVFSALALSNPRH